MNNKKIEPFKLKLKFELAYEVISYSTLTILIGIAFVFGSNLLTFNWYSFIFAIIAIFFLYLKRNSYLVIENHKLSIFYMQCLQKAQVDMKDIEEFNFFEQDKQVKIKTNSKQVITIHLTDRNKQRLLDWLVQYYPTIPCLYLKHRNN